MADLSKQELNALKTAPMFSALDEAAVRELAKNCSKVAYGHHEIICRPEERAKFFFVILQGHVRVFKLNPNGDQQVLHIFGPGQSFAEAAAMKLEQYPAWAEAMDNVIILAIDRETFQASLRTNMEMVAGLVAGLSSKLKELAGLAEQLSLRKVPSRLAHVLLEEMRVANSETFKLSRAKKDIAATLGTTPETLSRTLRTFCKDGLIEMAGKEIKILNVSKLADLAAGVG